MAALRKAGFQVYYDEAPDTESYDITAYNRRRSRLLCKLFGEDFVGTATSVTAPVRGGGSFKLFFYSEADDNSIGPLRNLPHLWYVSLSYSQVTDAGIRTIQDLVEVRYLSLKETKITDDGLVSLARMTHLHRLDITNTHVTDAGLKHLKLFPELKILFVGGERITDRGVAELANLHGLEELRIETRICGKERADQTFPTIITDEAADSLKLALPNCKISYETELP